MSQGYPAIPQSFKCVVREFSDRGTGDPLNIPYLHISLGYLTGGAKPMAVVRVLAPKSYRFTPNARITSYNVCYTKLLRQM